ncbi:MAG: amidohydrolase [Alistipes sp.]|nr:amidohydrolase [Alistipes sp.]
MKQRVAIVQRDIVWSDIEANLEVVERMLSGVKADVVVLSEMFQTGFVTNPQGVADEGRTLKWMKRVATQLDAAVVGSVAIRQGEEYRNRLYFVKPDGESLYYDKFHLFSVGGESKHFTAGRERVVVEWRGVRYLLAICYDLRFPVWSRQRGDYDAMIYTALWPKVRREVWRTLLRARAIENQVYVIGVNRVGEEPTGLVYSGDSAVIGYHGEAVKDMGDEQGVAIAEIDIVALGNFREKFAVWRDADSFELK